MKTKSTNQASTSKTKSAVSLRDLNTRKDPRGGRKQEQEDK